LIREGATSMKSNAELQRDVMNELRWEPSINAENVGVAVDDGVVTLSGAVESFAQKWAAERATKRVAGVKAFAENIEVKLPPYSRRTDADIARSVANVLEWNVDVPHEQIKVMVQDGWVTLSGEVEWLYQKNAAYDAIRNLTGVRAVTNQIVVKPSKPSMEALEVKVRIQEAFERNVRLDIQRIKVETNNGQVVLRGAVSSWAEREEAERAACAAPGVCEVLNELTVKA
jgi:osmotically-inducible protein OsmY